MDSFSDTIIFESSLVRIGAFRCDRDYASFEDTGPIQNDCFVFPRTAVAIEHEHKPAFAMNPNFVAFYNRFQRYRRYSISDRGDRCDWFSVSREVAREAVAGVDRAVEENPFPWTRGHCDARTYFLQRRLFEGIVRGEITDCMAIEETVLLLLDRVIGAAAAPQAKPQALLHDVECMLAARFDEPISLDDIASGAGVSVYHLCHRFREATGYALHQYLKQLRIRNGLEMVSESVMPLARIAVDLGFTHHSHFTSAFRREFGVPPSSLRC